jgi:anti-sigma regulatory factor (Ser/Thr protein kinase)
VAGVPLNELTGWITVGAVRHPVDLAAQVAARHGVGTRAAQAALARLVALQWLVREPGRGPARYRPGALRQVVQRYVLAELDEHACWLRDFAPYLQVPAPAERLARHVLTELLRNARVHSGAERATASLRQTPTHLQLLVSDPGVGLFQRLGDRLAAHDPEEALRQIDAGALAPPPDHEPGRGLRFASTLADVFDLHANGSAFQRRGWDDRGWRSRRAVPQPGTSVYASFVLDTARDLDALRQADAAPPAELPAAAGAAAPARARRSPGQPTRSTR